LGCLLIIGFFTDLEEQIIPDEIVVIGILAGFIFNITKGQTINSLLGAASGFAIFFLIAEIAKFIVKKDAIGFGDLKLAAMLGAFLGTSGFWNTFLLAYLLGAVISIGLIIFKFKKMGDYIPFGPFLIIGAALTLYFGPFLILQYFNPLIQ